MTSRGGGSRLGLLAYAIAALVLLADQLSKGWVLNAFKLGYGVSRQALTQACDMPPAPISVLPVLQLHLVCNGGVSFGLLRADSDLGRWLLVGFSAIVIVLLAVWAARQTRALAAVAMGLIMGGASGNNFIDRVRFGHVVDFIDFGGLHFFPWVFNVADSAITVGVALLLLDSLITREDKPGAAVEG